MPFSVLTCFLCAALLAPAQAQQGRGGARRAGNPVNAVAPADARAAVIIGVDDYAPSSGLTPLRFSSDDARAIYRQLVESGTFQADQVVLMTSDAEDPALRPTVENVMLQLMGLPRRGPLDTAVVYFSGHGGMVANGEGMENVIFLMDAQAPQSNEAIEPGLSSGTLPVAMLEVAMLDAKARKRVVIVDACRSGARQGKGGDDFTWAEERDVRSEGTYLLMGTRPGMRSFEDASKSMGRLTWYLVEGMQGAADTAGNRDGWVGMDELYTWVDAAMEASEQRGSDGTPMEQRPYRGGDWAGEDIRFVKAQELEHFQWHHGTWDADVVGTWMRVEITPERYRLSSAEGETSPWQNYTISARGRDSVTLDGGGSLPLTLEFYDRNHANLAMGPSGLKVVRTSDGVGVAALGGEHPYLGVWYQKYVETYLTISPDGRVTVDGPGGTMSWRYDVAKNPAGGWQLTLHNDDWREFAMDTVQVDFMGEDRMSFGQPGTEEQAVYERVTEGPRAPREPWTTLHHRPQFTSLLGRWQMTGGDVRLELRAEELSLSSGPSAITGVYVTHSAGAGAWYLLVQYTSASGATGETLYKVILQDDGSIHLQDQQGQTVTMQRAP
ncbi:MAG: caspase family protein [Alphaproteobacteria bacterium]|nr:caspase family protein [Alphaproteobacteria bacterium]MCB9798026.1 caspase family protein [Alphaproteobacteria bacterium]